MVVNIEITCFYLNVSNLMFPTFQGGFAKCYEMKNMLTGEVVACKVVPKSLLVKQNQREKMAQEIRFPF
jgi:hypothetical protein